MWLYTMLSTTLHAPCCLVQVDDIEVCLQEQERAQAGLH